MLKIHLFWGMEAAGGDLDRQTTLPRGRGVCLISFSCPGALTAATGSELAGRRLQGARSAPCSAWEAVALWGHPLYYECFRWFDPVRSVGSPHPRPIALHCPPLRGGRRRGAPGGGVCLRDGLAPPFRARSVVRSTT